jgi:putative FmdB family regulatory protein
MPLYEFECPGCGERTESLVSVGTETLACPACGEAEARRIFSPYSPNPKLATSLGNRRRQEARNARLHAKAKADFKAARQRSRGEGSR